MLRFPLSAPDHSTLDRRISDLRARLAPGQQLVACGATRVWLRPSQPPVLAATVLVVES